jgi:putative transposase
MSRRGNPHNNAKAESFKKALKVKAADLAAHEMFAFITADRPRFIDDIYTAARPHFALGYLSPVQFDNQHAQQTIKSEAESCPPAEAHSTTPHDR